MIAEQVKAYLAYCKENGLDPKQYKNLKDYCESTKTEE